MSTQSQITYYPLTVIKSSQLNPRKLFDESSLKELAESLITMGMLSPIICRQNKNGKALLEIVCGERRFRAAKIAGLDQVPVIFKDLTDDEALDLMITENLQRSDVSPLEEASSFKKLIEIGKYDIQALASRFGKSETYIRIRLKLNDLIPEFRELLGQDVIAVSHAQEICKISENYQKELYDSGFKERAYYWRTPTLKDLKDTITSKFLKLLKEANFPLDDSLLLPLAGACNTCIKNTASNALLFPESKAHCLDHICFNNKSDAFLKQELTRIQDNCPEVIIGSRWVHRTDEQRQVKEMIEDGIPIIEVTPQTGWKQVTPPKLDEEPQIEDHIDLDLYQEAVKEYETEKEEYQKDLDEYNKKVASGEYRQVFIAAGPDKGKTMLFEKEETPGDKKDKSPDMFINKQVQELKQKDHRNWELSFEKKYNDAKQLLKSEEYISRDEDLSENESVALFAILLKNLYPLLAEDISGNGHTHYLAEKDRIQFAWELTPQMKNRVFRNFIRHELETATPLLSISDANCLIKIVGDLFPEEYEKVEATHNATYLRRKEKIDQRITELTRKPKK